MSCVGTSGTENTIKRRAEAVLAGVQRRHGHFQQMNLEPWGERWRLRYRRRDPGTGESRRHSVLLRGTPVESAAMARHLERRLADAKQACRRQQFEKAMLESERRRCQSLVRKLRARVLAACPHGRRQREDLGRAFDDAAALGLEPLETFLRYRLWEKPPHQRRLDAFEADMLVRHPFLGRITV